MSSADPSGTPAQRASDADRDRVIELLRTAVADGRLEAAEFHERLDTALAARTFEALAPLTVDLTAPSGRAAITAAEPAAKLLIVEQKHGVVRREGRWTLPHRLAVRTSWSGVLLDLTESAHPEPELIVELKVTGGTVELVLAPGMTLDANDLSAKFTALAIERPAPDRTPQTLHIRLTGKAKHADIAVRWQAPR